MRYVIPTLFCLLFAGSVLAQTSLPANPASPSDPTKCSISGTVLRKDTGEPLSKARVELSSRERAEDSTYDVTDAQGNFLLEDVNCHAYQLSVSHSGFVESSYGQRASSDPGAVLTLSLGQKITGLVFRLSRTAVLTGHVYDETGQLVEGAGIRAIRQTGHGNRREYQQVGGFTTNDLGEFRIYNLEPGRYYLAAVYDPWPYRKGFDTRPERRLLKKGYPAIFYPNTADPAKAQSFTISAGEELPPIDFQLQLTPMNTVSGRVLNMPAAKGGQGAQVYLFPDSSITSGVDLNDLASTTKDGSFTIYRVPPGSYYLQAAYTDHETHQPVWARRRLEVSGADVEGVTLVFSSTFSLRGHLTWEGNPPVNGSDPFYVFLTPTDEGSFQGTQPAEVKADGSFVLRSISEGEYRPSIPGNAAENCFLKSGRLGSAPMAEGKIQISSGTDSALELVANCYAPRVEGQVLTGDSLPAVGVFVVLVPEERRRADDGNYYSERTDQNGHFLLKGIQPGDYKLFSWSGIEEGDWLDPDFLPPFEGKGVSVHLEEGDRKTLDTTLIDTSAEASPKQ
jgi:Carboxypeptidase regulatory-like domain